MSSRRQPAFTPDGTVGARAFESPLEEADTNTWEIFGEHGKVLALSETPKVFRLTQVLSFPPILDSARVRLSERWGWSQPEGLYGSDENVDLYDGLAEDYHLVYQDWEALVERQAEALDRIIREILGDRPKRILECSCGLGTQCLGLARRGHDVLAVDLSPRAVERGRVEAGSAGLQIEFRVGDLRHLESVTAWNSPRWPRGEKAAGTYEATMEGTEL